MKFNNKFNIAEYIQVVNEIAEQFFDVRTGEYLPHIGEIHTVGVYYNYCVQLEADDEITKHPIDDINDMQQLFNNDDFMDHFYTEINNYSERTHDLTFANAHYYAMLIVENRKNDAYAFASAISNGINEVLKSFRESFSESDIQSFIEIAQDIKDGKISSDSIIKAYENSERFAEGTKEIEDEAKIIRLPEKR